MNIYVIIVTWNGMEWIERCLSALRNSTFPIKTIVVDNGSTDGTVKHIKLSFPEVELYVMPNNLGFGQANNYGIRKALENNCDFVYLLNQDAYVYPDMFERLMDVYSHLDKDNIGIVAPLHLYRDKVHFDNHFKGYLSQISNDVLEDSILGVLKPYYEVDMVPAAGWLIPRKTLSIVGGFDPIYFHYGEDEQYSQRLKFHGLSIIIVPNAKMIHDRESFGNEKIARKDDLFKGLKTYYFLNINYNKATLLKKLGRVVRSYLYESIKCLFKGQFNRSLSYYSAFFRNITNIPKYRKNRMSNRQKGANWL